jgi:hypothetical protein
MSDEGLGRCPYGLTLPAESCPLPTCDQFQGGGNSTFIPLES